MKSVIDHLYYAISKEDPDKCLCCLRFNDKVYIAALQDFRISRSSGIMVRGPLAQLIPTTAAPASSRRRQASGIGTPSIVSSGQYGAKVMTAGTPIVRRQLKKVDKSWGFFSF